MYWPGQIIYDLDKRKAVQINDIWDPSEYPERNIHFLKSDGKFGYTLATPHSVEEAEDHLAKGIIQPAPQDVETHCWKCGNWYNNCRHFKTCSESNKPIPRENQK